MSVDEAGPGGTVVFSQPVALYVENFLNIPVGTPVPTGRYDREQGAVIEQRSAGHLRRLGLAKGMRTLRDDGLRLVRAGITTVEEVLRVADVGGE